MTEEQATWLAEHPNFKAWRQQYVVSLTGWADVGYVLPRGEFVEEGTHHGWAWPTHLMSSGDTLYVMPKDAIKVGREYMKT